MIVLTCTTESLYDRLKARDYNDLKLNENISCEIMGICKEEALENWENVLILESHSVQDMEENIDKIIEFIKTWFFHVFLFLFWFFHVFFFLFWMNSQLFSSHSFLPKGPLGWNKECFILNPVILTMDGKVSKMEPGRIKEAFLHLFL